MIHPKHWWAAPAAGSLFFLSKLPRHWQDKTTRHLGSWLFKRLKKRRKVCLHNIGIAYPEFTESQRMELAKASFISLLDGLIDASISWWGSTEDIAPCDWQGEEHLQAALASGRPIIICGAHFTSIEIGGRIFSQHYDVDTVYRKHQNPLLEKWMMHWRKQRYADIIAREDGRKLIKALKLKHNVWLATDQNYAKKNHIMVDFFNQPAPSNPSLSRLSSVSNAILLPFFCTRKTYNKRADGYVISIHPPITLSQTEQQSSPEEQAYATISHFHNLLEQQIKQSPEQYLWSHRRYKPVTRQYTR